MAQAAPTTPAEAEQAGLAQAEALALAEAAAAGSCPSSITVSVRSLLTGDTLTEVELRPTDTMDIVVSAVKTSSSCPEPHRLVYQGRVLHEQETPATIGLYDGAVISALFFTPRTLITASADGTAKLFESETGSCVRTFEGHLGGILSAVFSSDAKKVLTGSVDCTAKIFSVSSGLCEQTLAGHKGSVQTATFSPDGNQVLTASYDGTVKLFDAVTGSCVQSFRRDGEATIARSVDFLPGAKMAVAATGGQVAKLLNVETGSWEASFTGHSELVRMARVSPDGSKVLTASNDRTAKLWDVGSAKCKATFGGHTKAVCAAAFSPNGALAATASDDATAKVYAVVRSATTAPTTVARDEDTERVAEELFGGSTEGTPAAPEEPPQLSGQPLQTLEGHDSALYAVCFSPDSTKVLTTSVDRTARVFDVATGKCEQTLTGHKLPVRMAVFSPDGKKVLTASHDQTAKLFDVELGVCETTFEGHKQAVYVVAFMPETAAEEGV